MQFFKQLFSPQQPTSLRLSLAKGALLAFTVQVAGVGLTYIVHIFLARWMGSQEFGIYEYVISCISLFAIFAQLGLPTAVLRFIAQYQVTEQWGALQGLLRGSWLLILSTSLLSSALVTILLLILNLQDWEYFIPLQIGIWLLPCVSLAQLQSEMGRGIQKIAIAYLPLQVFAPILMLGSSFLLIQFYPPLTSIKVILAWLLTLCFIIALQFRSLQQIFSQEFHPAPAYYPIREWLSVALPLLLQGVFSVILTQTDLIMIGAMINPKAVALYSVATKTAIWTTFVLTAVNTVIAPVFAALYTQKKHQELQHLVATASHWIFWPSLIIALGLLGFSSPILQLFGSEFQAARLPMLILILGQLINVGSGSVGYLMVMTGHQNQSALIFGISAFLNLVLNAILIPLWGNLGAAIATASTMAIWNIWLHILVVRYLNVYPAIIYNLLPSFYTKQS